MELNSPAFKTLLAQCIHCGMCLQACPTHIVWGTEMDSPRGRIRLMRAASEGELDEPADRQVLIRHLDRCLTCRACETACPSGVHYGTLVETAREALQAQRRPGAGERFVRWLFLRQMMPHVGRLKLVARLMWVYQRTGLSRLFRALTFMPKPLVAMEGILPPITPHYLSYRAPAPAIGQKRGEVALFIGCIQEAFLAPVNQATVRVLQRNGYEVHFPAGQTCCGAAHLHTGESGTARQLARQNIDAFMTRDYDAVINNAGGCGATLKDEYVALFDDEPVYAERARRFGARVKDISEFLVEHLNVPPAGTVPVTATYSDSCHLRHVQKVVTPPRQLLARIPGVRLVELAHPERCCGSAGVYNIVHATEANAVLDLKMAEIAATGARLIVTSNTGCHMQLIAGARRAGLDAPVLHVVQVLDMSYQAMERST